MLISRLAIDDVASQISEVLENIRNKAPEIIAQHLDIVMNHAFSGLKDLPKAEWDAVCRLLPKQPSAWYQHKFKIYFLTKVKDIAKV